MVFLSNPQIGYVDHINKSTQNPHKIKITKISWFNFRKISEITKWIGLAEFWGRAESEHGPRWTCFLFKGLYRMDCLDRTFLQYCSRYAMPVVFNKINNNNNKIQIILTSINCFYIYFKIYLFYLFIIYRDKIVTGFQFPFLPKRIQDIYIYAFI